jgi:hypothetical protein
MKEIYAPFEAFSKHLTEAGFAFTAIFKLRQCAFQQSFFFFFFFIKLSSLFIKTMDQLFQFKEDQIEGAVAPEIDPFRTSMAEGKALQCSYSLIFLTYYFFDYIALNCAVCNEVFTDPHLLSCGKKVEYS